MTTKPSANELRALVAELKPRSPQEVMGAAASSNLMASMLTATVTATALVVGATFLMFSLGFGPTASQETAQANANQSEQIALHLQGMAHGDWLIIYYLAQSMDKANFYSFLVQVLTLEKT